jgi:limonene-1,2-epoxide hydrolase
VQGYPFANWDTTAFPEPERFDVQPKERNHLAFGTGPHSCIGQRRPRVATLPRGLDLRGVEPFHQGMTADPDTVVTEFCALWSKPNLDEILGRFTEDAVYHNIPMPAAQGHAAIREFIAGFLAGCDGIDFTVHRQIAKGALVMNERTDVMRLKKSRQVALPVMGTFEVRDGRIAAWRDYFDLATVTAAFG